MSFVDLLQVLGVAEEAEASSADDAHTLTWRDVRYAVGSRSILEGSTGAARPGRLLGVLGPSGSGKTTLLNILAGRVRRRRGAALEASVAYGGGAFPRDDVPLSYIEQDPRFFSNLTVRETLALDAALHGGDEADVDRVVKRLGLAACADTLVGGDTGGKAVRGISGGERRRLAIAAETLCLRARSSVGPADAEAEDVVSADASVEKAHASVELGAGGVILADEPTTGLDAHQADKIVEKLRELARLESAAVVCVLHQPRSAIFDRLDDLALVAAGGRVAYCGAAEDALAWFAERGHRCPKYHNPAEFLIDLVAVNDDAGEDEARRDRERVDALVARWDEERRRVEEGNDKNATPTGKMPGGSDAKQSASEAGGSPSPLGSPVSPIIAKTPELDAGVEAEGGGGGGDAAAAAERSAGGFETGFEALLGGSPSGSPLSSLFGPFAPATPEGAPKGGAAASSDAAGPEAASDADANRPAKETTSVARTAAEETKPVAKKPREKNPRPRSRLGAWRQFHLLAGRAWRQTRREAWVNGVRLAASAGLALAFGATNRAVGFGPRSIKRRAAVMMQAAINTSMLAICRSLNGFPRERATVRREMSRTRGGYAPGPYFFSKLLVETPVDAIFPVVFGSVMAPLVGLRREGRGWFLTTLALQTASASCLGMSVGALAPSAEMALAIGPCLMVLSIMLGDETGAFAEVPESLRSVSHASLIKWAFRGCLCAEFEGLEFDPEGDAKRKTSAADPTRAGTAKRRSGFGSGGGLLGAGIRGIFPRGGDAARAARRGGGMDGGACPRTGEEVLEGLGLPTSGGAKAAAKAQARVFLANAAVTYLALRIKGA